MSDSTAGVTARLRRSRVRSAPRTSGRRGGCAPAAVMPYDVVV